MNADVYQGPWGGAKCRDSLAQVRWFVFKGHYHLTVLELHKPGLAVPTFSFQPSNATTARLAQLGEHPSAEQEVVGSTLARPTTKVFKKTLVLAVIWDFSIHIIVLIGYPSFNSQTKWDEIRLTNKIWFAFFYCRQTGPVTVLQASWEIITVRLH